MFINLQGLPPLLCLIQAHLSLGNKYLSVCMDILTWRQMGGLNVKFLTKRTSPPYLFDIHSGGSQNHSKCMANSTISNHDWDWLCIAKLESITGLTKLPQLLHYCMIIHNNGDDAGGDGDKNNQIRHSYLLIVPQL